MKTIAFSGLAILSVFLATEASATNHPHPCAQMRDTCKISYPAANCDKVYQDAIANNGVWKAHYFDRRMNQMVDQPINCTF
jgi:hypothetical protein